MKHVQLGILHGIQQGLDLRVYQGLRLTYVRAGLCKNENLYRLTGSNSRERENMLYRSYVRIIFP